MKIITENTSTLESLLNRVKNIQGVQKAKTDIALSTIKDNYSVIADEEKTNS